MPISRRSLLAASTAMPWLTSCATGPYPVQSHPLPELASRLGVPAASYVTLEAGRPGETVWLHADARAAATPPARPIFQAASLTKPVVAFVALKLARQGRLDLRAPVSRYLASGTSWFGWGREHPFRTPNAAASLHTTAADYARLMAAWLADPALVGTAMAEPVSVSPELGLSWGLGWGVMAAPGGPYLWQWGNNPGFRAFAIMSVASSQGFVLLANSERGMPLATALTRDLLPGALEVFRFPPLG